MHAVKISSQWYVVRDGLDAKAGFVILDGPYPEEWQAVSQARLREIES